MTNFFSDVTFYLFKEHHRVKIYRTSDLDSMMNGQPEDGLFHYIQGHEFDQINSLCV